MPWVTGFNPNPAKLNTGIVRASRCSTDLGPNVIGLTHPDATAPSNYDKSDRGGVEETLTSVMVRVLDRGPGVAPADLATASPDWAGVTPTTTFSGALDEHIAGVCQTLFEFLPSSR